METAKDLATSERRGWNSTRFPEPVERRGKWSEKPFMTAARKAWNERQPSFLIKGNERNLARGLGWFSIGLGLAEVLAPKALERFLGIKHHVVLLRLRGLREIGFGIGILAGARPGNWLWARVGGDVLDIAGLGMAFDSETAKPVNIGIACAAATGITVLDFCCARELGQSDAPLDARTVEVRESIQINCTPAELYKFWRNFQNLPKFMSNLESVETLGDNRFHWLVRGPAGKRIEWDAEITEEQENQLIAWRSLPGAQVENCGTIRFANAPAGRGAYVKVHLQYSPPWESLGATVAKLFGREPQQQVHEDLRRLKQIVEAGEIVTTKGQPAGRARGTSRKYDQAVRRQVDLRSANRTSAA